MLRRLLAVLAAAGLLFLYFKTKRSSSSSVTGGPDEPIIIQGNTAGVLTIKVGAPLEELPAPAPGLHQYKYLSASRNITKVDHTKVDHNYNTVFASEFRPIADVAIYHATDYGGVVSGIPADVTCRGGIIQTKSPLIVPDGPDDTGRYEYRHETNGTINAVVIHGEAPRRQGPRDAPEVTIFLTDAPLET